VKKIIVCLIFASGLAVIPAPSLFADWGIKGGAGISGLHSATGDFRHYLGYEMDWLRMGNLLSYQIGVSQSFSLSDKFQIQPELFYSVRGGDAGEEYLFESVIYKIKMTYLEIPLLFKYRIPVISNLKLVLYLGPYAALKLKAQKHTEIWGEKEDSDLPNVKNYDYGIVLGIGTEFKLRSGSLILELRSNWGLADILTMPAGYIRLYEEKDSIRNFAVVFITGYQF
jgi:hypothetical protein